MGKLDGIIALIAGGTGTVGEGIVRACFKEGAQVIVPSRSTEAINKLRELIGAHNNEQLITLREILAMLLEQSRYVMRCYPVLVVLMLSWHH